MQVPGVILFLFLILENSDGVYQSLVTSIKIYPNKKILATYKAKKPTKTILGIGDSIMLQYVGMMKLRAEVAYISDWDHIENLFQDVIPKTSTIERPFDAVFLNFAALHALHLHKDGFWKPSYIKETYFLESMMMYEMVKYQTIADKIVFLTPPRVCEKQYTGDYKVLIENIDMVISKCAAEVQRSATEIMTKDKRGAWAAIHETASSSATLGLGFKVGNLSDHHIATEFCRNGTFTEQGSRSYADRIKNFAAIYNVTVIDHFDFTLRAGCEHVRDARHYDAYTLLNISLPFVEAAFDLKHMKY